MIFFCVHAYDRANVRNDAYLRTYRRSLAGTMAFIKLQSKSRGGEGGELKGGSRSVRPVPRSQFPVLFRSSLSVCTSALRRRVHSAANCSSNLRYLNWCSLSPSPPPLLLAHCNHPAPLSDARLKP